MKLKMEFIIVTFSFFYFISCDKGSTTMTSPVVSPPAVIANRNKFLWPFSKTSIWNMPLGSNAVYVDSDFGEVGLFYADAEYIYQSNATDPLQKVYLIGGWVPRVPTVSTPSYISIHIPDNYLIPDATTVPYYTPNNCAAFIEPDSLNYYELEPLTRPENKGKVYAYNANRNGIATQSIKEDGTWGAHFGSGLSTLGGSIRVGEINGVNPIRHAIKLEFDTHVFWKNPTNAAQSYRWPAYNCDGNTISYGIYNTSNKAQAVGALLAIPPSIKMENLNLKTAQAKKIFQALQDYGAYIVDATGDGYKPNGGYSVTICAEKKVIDTEFDFNGSQGNNVNWFTDCKALIKVLKIVDNNSATSIGGGGTPRQPLAPNFIN